MISTARPSLYHFLQEEYGCHSATRSLLGTSFGRCLGEHGQEASGSKSQGLQSGTPTVLKHSSIKFCIIVVII